MGARITSIGTYVPQKRLTNFDLERMVDTSNEWIVQRTGIHERRISRDDEFTSDLCVAAVEDLMHRYNKIVQDVDMVIVATSTPDFPFPSVACLIQQRLNISPTAGCMDLSAACAGFVYGLHTAHAMIASGLHRKILVIGADALSKITDYTDRSTCILFGDGAGAVLVEESVDNSFIGYHLGSDGSGAQHIYRRGLSNQINGIELADSPFLVQNGREVLRWVLRNVPQGIETLLNKSNMQMSEVNWFIPHSANLRIIEPICERIDFPMEQTLYSITNYGNTSAASIPLALDMGIREGKVHSGDRILLYGFGAGIVHAGQLLDLRMDEQVDEPMPL
jgi:3-oxoacyl-[acyl-carrier-protein] synthase-3